MTDNNNEKVSTKQIFKEYLFVIFLGIALNLIFNCFFGISKVSGLSMYPTLNDKQYVFYTKNHNEYDYNDIVIFKSNLIQNNKRLDVVKRVIAKEGDKITIQDGKVFVNDILINENYLADNTQTYGQLEYIVPDDSYFLLGDNRENSVDSRDPIIGCILINDIKGKLKQ